MDKQLFKENIHSKTYEDGDILLFIKDTILENVLVDFLTRLIVFKSDNDNGRNLKIKICGNEEEVITELLEKKKTYGIIIVDSSDGLITYLRSSDLSLYFVSIVERNSNEKTYSSSDRVLLRMRGIGPQITEIITSKVIRTPTFAI